MVLFTCAAALTVGTKILRTGSIANYFIIKNIYSRFKIKQRRIKQSFYHRVIKQNLASVRNLIIATESSEKTRIAPLKIAKLNFVISLFLKLSQN